MSEFRTDWYTDYVKSKIKPHLDALRELANHDNDYAAQSAFMILRYCAEMKWLPQCYLDVYSVWWHCGVNGGLQSVYWLHRMPANNSQLFWSGIPDTCRSAIARIGANRPDTWIQVPGYFPGITGHPAMGQHTQAPSPYHPRVTP